MNDQGFWLAYWPDLSGLVAFSEEIDALRHAVENSMDVRWIQFDVDIRSQLNA